MPDPRRSPTSSMMRGAPARRLFEWLSRPLAIHNMGQGCRYCTRCADGINCFLAPSRCSAIERWCGSTRCSTLYDPAPLPREADRLLPRHPELRVPCCGGAYECRDVDVMRSLGRSNAAACAVVYEKRGPRKLAFTEPHHVMASWSGRGIASTTSSLELRVALEGYARERTTWARGQFAYWRRDAPPLPTAVANLLPRRLRRRTGRAPPPDPRRLQRRSFGASSRPARRVRRSILNGLDGAPRAPVPARPGPPRRVRVERFARIAQRYPGFLKYQPQILTTNRGFRQGKVKHASAFWRL